MYQPVAEPLAPSTIKLTILKSAKYITNLLQRYSRTKILPIISINLSIIFNY